VTDNDKREFSDLLRSTFDVYGRAMPAAETQRIWWNLLNPHQIAAVRAAFGRFIATEPKFPPTPAQILALLGNGPGDARPGSDEAWATALLSRDEASTVVWTEETAAAFAICQPVLAIGDEIGARMAFRQAYDRLVGEARAQRKPVRWQASLGWDSQLRERALTHAATVGLLPAATVTALLPPPPEVQPTTVQAAAQLAKIKAMVAAMRPASHVRNDALLARHEAERQRLDAQKADIAARVRERDEA
jgi:hypothetical protein